MLHHEQTISGEEMHPLIRFMVSVMASNKVDGLLNQACAGLWSAYTWFLELLLSANVCMRVCVFARVCVCVSTP